MTTQINLKKANTKYIWVFFCFNLALIITLFFTSYFDDLLNDYKSFLSIRFSSIAIAPLLIFIINGILSSNQKAIIVFWRFKDTLPGCRAFTKYGVNDYRVNMDNLQLLHGNLPSTAKEQNALWYKIFKSHNSDLAIQKSHKDFLLARDISSIAFLFLILSGIPFLFIGGLPINWIYFLFLIFQYFLLILVAQNHGRRFVSNVLAAESAK